jgi:transcriptional regulator with XRE-family HTH domain
LARKKYTEVERNIIEEVSKNLKRVMFNKGLSQKDVCDRSKLPTSTISDYVNAKTLISMGNLNKIAEALGVTKGEIYPIDDQNKNPNSSANEKEFISKIDLSNDELSKQFKIIVDGRELTAEEMTRIIARVRLDRDLEKKD